MGLAAAALVASFTDLGAAATVPVSRLQLTWNAPPECPTSDQIRQDVRSLIAREPTDSTQPIQIEASIQATGDGRYALSLNANGQARRIVGVSCAKVAEAAALLLAMLLDPSLSPETAKQPEAAAPEPKPNPAHPESASNAQSAVNIGPAPTPRDRAAPTKTKTATRHSLVIEAAGRLDIGNWPEVEPFVIAGIGLRTPLWRVLAHGGLGKRVVLGHQPTPNLEWTPMTLSVEPAFRFVRHPWSLEPGVGAELGITHSRSSELEPRARDGLSLSLWALLRASWEIGWGLNAWLGAGAGLPLLRPRWVSQTGEVYHTFGPSIRVELGLQAAF